MRRLWATCAAAVLLVVATGAPAAAAPAPIDIVHAERVQIGASTLTASFSRWPLESHRSLDFTFEPEGGIDGRTGLLRVVSPSGETEDAVRTIGLDRRGDALVLPRHPRARDVWGLDVVALTEEGTWRFEFTVESPQGTVTGVLPLRVEPAPGPPFAVSWIVSVLPWIPIVPLLVYGWIRTRPLRRRAGLEGWSG
ncbi:hypothetical protein GCM10022225_37200 [Plantactinospora mayteni]|uniref:Uncharacterized protein n=1 Tax=Plantactinospora mayteni TaxID=566021 RepID=A0ABQ4EKZ8_9ACTN|nr:hypothetical protein [Plantactinospora mayteni]GIG95300.1 hypothetical protein Pma05_18730 [Plantactinospora mayteni]